jgi:hypothetical protein
MFRARLEIPAHFVQRVLVYGELVERFEVQAQLGDVPVGKRSRDSA